MGGVGRATGVGSSGEEEEEEQDEDEEDEERGVGETALVAVSTSIAGTLDDSTLSSKPSWNSHPQQQQQQEQYLRQHKRHHGWRRQSRREYTKRNEACGMCGCKPRWMQIFNNPRALLFFLCSGSFIQGKYCFFSRLLFTVVISK